MKTSDAGKIFIKGYEELMLEAYQDGGGVWTYGYGHIHNVKKGDVITAAQAEQFFNDDLAPVEITLNAAIKVAVTQNQFDALASLTFNIGNAAVTSSTLLKKLNASDYSGAANEFPKWCHDNGKIVKGLQTRRNAEKAVFLS